MTNKHIPLLDRWASDDQDGGLVVSEGDPTQEAWIENLLADTDEEIEMQVEELLKTETPKKLL